MKKFMLGVITTLGALGIGKTIYNKGRKDEAKELKKSYDQLEIGMKLGEKINKES